jgi:soluble lytic murein transglycosylase-like protein
MQKLVSAFLLCLISPGASYAQGSDAALRRVMDQDAATPRQKLPAAEHMARAEVYFSNRLFPEARRHWQAVLDDHPGDPGTPKALFGMGRSYMWERQYQKAVDWFDKLTKDHLGTKDGREGLAFKGASYVRMGKNLEAARVYEQYVIMFPQGERYESAHLNLIDANREAGRYEEALRWSRTTVERFRGKPAEMNSLHALLRLELHRANWAAAIAAADELLAGKSFRGSMTGIDEVRFLKAMALDRSGKKKEAASLYAVATGYYGSLAADKCEALAREAGVSCWDTRPRMQRTVSLRPVDYPVVFRAELLRESAKRKIDPRFLLAVMKQESSFRPEAKSPAGARGLLQLVFDTATKYSKKAGYPDLRPDDLYVPAVNIAIGAEYIRDLKDEFGGLYEAIAASYNGGEDNVARWLNRSKPKEAGIFAAEIGFAETKDYVFKVMSNYRVYRELYNEDLTSR